ncbi:helix-turn-helix domain-containing protein [Streptomyces yerevanensis]|uniref:helix-turn-helix domain-containing protein n=1 Tax=Streptomyces yerevanensis TaxID=66378 RepID=UPI00068F993F|nr:helix-turn-helix transcriptional regulator [Streptomyces yerevanensis]
MAGHMRYKALRARRLKEQSEEVAERLKAQRAYRLQGDLAQIFYDRRKELGYSQSEAASRCGITQAKVSIIEGSGAHPTPALLEKISRGLEASITVVYHREKDHEISLVPEPAEDAA